MAALVVDLEQRLVAVEREGRPRLRQARRLLQGAAPGREADPRWGVSA